MGWATSLRVFTTKYFQLFHMTFYWNDYEMNLGVSTLKKAVTAAIAISRTLNLHVNKVCKYCYLL